MAEAVVKVIFMLTLYYYYGTIRFASANNLLLQYDSNYCRHPCPEDILVFVCIVNGGGATIWRGNCHDGSQITLRHSVLILAMESEGLVMMITLSPMTLMSQITPTALNSTLQLVQKCTMELLNASMIH